MLCWVGLGWDGLGWVGLGWFGLGWVVLYCSVHVTSTYIIQYKKAGIIVISLLINSKEAIFQNHPHNAYI